MNSKAMIPAVAIVVLLLGGVFIFKSIFSVTKNPGSVQPTPTPQAVEQLSEDKLPEVSMTFTPDGHYVTVNITKIEAAELEYNLIYDATVKKSQIQTGVTGSAKLDGQNKYSNKQLLGSESSGKYTYHENIKNGVMELTLRNDQGYSIYSGNYPFTVSAGKTIDVAAAE